MQRNFNSLNNSTKGSFARHQGYGAGEILRNLRVLGGATTEPFRIITELGSPHFEVARADTEEEFNEPWQIYRFCAVSEPSRQVIDDIELLNCGLRVMSLKPLQLQGLHGL